MLLCPPGGAGGFPPKYKTEAGSSGGSGGVSPKYQNADGTLVPRTERRLRGGPPELQKDFHVDKFPKFLCSKDETQHTQNYALFIPLNMNRTEITWNFNAAGQSHSNIDCK